VTPCSPCLEARLRRIPAGSHQQDELFRALQGFRRGLRRRSWSPRSGCAGLPRRGLPPLRPAPLCALPGDSGGRTKLQVAPSLAPTRVARSRASPGVRASPSGSAHRSRSPRNGPPEGGFPPKTVGCSDRSPRALTYRTGGVRARWPSPRPSSRQDPLRVHGHSSGCARMDWIRVAFPRVLRRRRTLTCVR